MRTIFCSEGVVSTMEEAIEPLSRYVSGELET
jgi:hypothetical protein